MTREEHALIQALRMEMNTSFTGLQQSIVELTAEQRAHLSAHEERDRARVEAEGRSDKTAVTRRWVIGVVFTAVSVIVATMGVAISVLKYFAQQG